MAVTVPIDVYERQQMAQVNNQTLFESMGIPAPRPRPITRYLNKDDERAKAIFEFASWDDLDPYELAESLGTPIVPVDVHKELIERGVNTYKRYMSGYDNYVLGLITHEEARRASGMPSRPEPMESRKLDDSPLTYGGGKRMYR